MSQEAAKRSAAERAVDMVQSGMRLGLGTGSTAKHVVDVLAERLEAGTLRDIVGVPTSRATEAYARERGVPLTTLDDVLRLDLTIDGADEIDPYLNLIKGLGGALLWEKIVATASDRVCIVADPSKLVDMLGTRAPIPVEVVQFGWRTHFKVFRALRGEPKLRLDAHGEPFVTDGGNYIIDVQFSHDVHDILAVDDPSGLDISLRGTPGVIETGLFLELAKTAVIGSADGVQVLEPSTDE